jgi:hypothetical protein
VRPAPGGAGLATGLTLHIRQQRLPVYLGLLDVLAQARLRLLPLLRALSKQTVVPDLLRNLMRMHDDPCEVSAPSRVCEAGDEDEKGYNSADLQAEVTSMLRHAVEPSKYPRRRNRRINLGIDRRQNAVRDAFV